MANYPHPIALAFIGPEWRDQVAAALSDHGWIVDRIINTDFLAKALISRPSMIVVDYNSFGAASLLTTVSLIRTFDQPSALIPIILLADDQSDDSVLALVGRDRGVVRTTAASLRTTVAHWTPEVNPALERLIVLFGAAEVTGLAIRFRDLLSKALDPMQTDAGVAHRIAGMAGTLGFARLGSLWSAVSLGDGDMAATARVTRMTICEITRRFGQADDTP